MLFKAFNNFVQYGKLAMKSVSSKDNVILCAVADKNIDLGMLKTKVEAASKYLFEPFDSLEVSEEIA